MMNHDYRQGPEFRTLLQNSGATVFKFGEEAAFSLRSPIPFLKNLMIPRVQNSQILKEIEKMPFKYRSQFMLVAPKVFEKTPLADEWQKFLSRFGYKPAKMGLAPTKTLEVDISNSEADILGQMLRQTRYNIGLSERKGVTTEIISGSKMLSDISHLDKFHKVYHDNCIRAKIKSYSKDKLIKTLEAFKDKIFFVHGHLNSEIVAVASFIISGNTVLYNLNGSTESGRKSFATKLVVWHGMKEGKRNNCECFDFDGVFDERYERGQKDWKGFSRFKSGFGGNVRAYMGSFVKWFPFLKKLN